MADFIKRSSVIDVLVDMSTLAIYEDSFETIRDIRTAVEKISAEDVSERKKGKWRGWTWEKCVDFETEKHKSVRGYTCSECQRGTAVATKFCPCCGAEMVVET